MRGFPKTIATRQDLDNLMPLFPEKTKAHLQRLLDARETWQITGEIKDDKDKKEDEKHKVHEEIDETGKIKKWQMELKEDANCALFRLGLTKTEAEGLVA